MRNRTRRRRYKEKGKEGKTIETDENGRREGNVREDGERRRK